MLNKVKDFSQPIRRAHFSRRLTLTAVSFIVLFTSLVSAKSLRSLMTPGNVGNQTERVLEVVEQDWPKEALELLEVKGWQAADFPKGLEVTVKNISTKPIYFYHLDVLFPESREILNGKLGSLPLMYGNPKLRDTSGRSGFPTDEDRPVKPGEIIRLSVSDFDANRFCSFLNPEDRAAMLDRGIRRIKMVSQVINFGDGTGYITSKQTPVKKIAMTTTGNEFRFMKASHRFSNGLGLQGGGNCFNGHFEDQTCHGTGGSCSVGRTVPTSSEDPLVAWSESFNTTCGCYSYTAASGGCV